MATKQEIFEQTLSKSYEQGSFVDFIREMISGAKIIAPEKELITYNTYAVFVSKYFHVGEYEDPEGDSIGIFAIELKRGESVERARSAQRSFVKTLLEKGGYAGALVAFYSVDATGKHLDTWRFSFIRMDYEFAKGKIKESLTPAKRYSYLVGKGEPCHTAMDRLLPIFMNDAVAPSLDELEEAFSVETVTKEFFEQYKEKYLEMKEFLEDNPEFVEEAENRGFTSEQFTKKLLAQIVFLYFVQKKGWMGVNAIPPVLTQSEYKKAFFAKGYGSKPKEVMPFVYQEKDNLFFRNGKALIQLDEQSELVLSKIVRGKRWGTGPKDFMRNIFNDCVKRDKNFFDDYLEPLFYTGLNMNRGEDAYFQPLHCRIPFLNGGLFEEMDNYDWRDNDFAIPNELFSNKEEKGREADGVLDIFDRYNFTMAEDEPMEREVAVDPEMLGKVFENLLDVKDRKSKGAFYTPREIVHYMCQESLINYLVTKSGIPEEDIRKLVLYGEYFKETDAEKTLPVDNKTGEVRQGQDLYRGGFHYELDKQKEFEIPASIFSYRNGVNRLKELDDLLANVKVVDPAVGSGAFPLGMLNEIVKTRDTLSTYMAIEMNPGQKKTFYAPGFVGSRNPYDLKSETIKNCIFACDVEPSATDIAKLRLWLSLVIDDELTDSSMDGGAFGEHSKPKQLPNLDCNIICGNSLVDSFEGANLISSSDVLKNISGEHQENMLQAGVDNMITTLIALQDKLFYTTEHHEKEQIKAQIQNVYDSIIEEQLRTNTELIEKYRASLKETSRPFVLWQLYFPKVFRENDGFDIAIGNPPYLESRSPNFSDELKDTLQANLKMRYGNKASCFARGSDLLIYFFELSLRLICKNGINTFITQNSWLDTEFGRKFQRYLLETTNILAVVDSDYKYFDTANINTVITFFQGNDGRTEPTCFARCHSKDNLFPVSTKGNIIMGDDITCKKIPCDSDLMKELKWGFIFNTDDKILDIISRANQKGLKIGQIPELSIGQGLNLKKAAVIDKEMVLQSNVESEATIPFFVTEEIGKYRWDTTEHFIIDKSKTHFRDETVELFDSRKTKKKPPVLIMPRGIGARHFCSYNELKGYSASCVDVYSVEGTSINEVILCLWIYMNSSLFWLIRELSGRKNLCGGMLKAEAVDIEQFSVYYRFNEMEKIREIFNNSNKEEISNAVKEIEKPMHRDIDQIVFDYIGLSQEERELVITTLKETIESRYNKSIT